MAENKPMKKSVTIALTIADAASWWCALVLVTFILICTFRETTSFKDDFVRGNNFMAGRPCDDIYIVSEGETLHSISDKCGDPFIVERNPHIHDPDDVFPGLVIKITPSSSRKLLK